jgi:hypothetical protein
MNLQSALLTRTAASLLILGGALAACGGGASTPAGANPGQTAAAGTAGAAAANSSAAANAPHAAIDACALVTQKEATAFLGMDPGPGTSMGSADVPSCAYGSLIIAVHPTDGGAQFAANTGALKGTANGHVISGVGDQAFATIVANTVADMEINKGAVLVSVEVQGDPSKQNITVEALTTLGQAIVGRL